MAKRTAYDHRERLQPVLGLSDEDLRRIPIWEGDHFDPNETYFNLNLPERGAFSGEPPTIQRPGPGDEYLYVAKSALPDGLWRRLVNASAQKPEMGNTAPTLGAHGDERKPPRVGRSDTDSLVHVDLPDE